MLQGNHIDNHNRLERGRMVHGNRCTFVTFEKTMSSGVQSGSQIRVSRISVAEINAAVSMDKYLGMFNKEEKT